MKRIGKYQNRQVFWFDYDSFQLSQLPKKNWLCLAMSDIEPNADKFEKFVRHSIEYQILEFKGYGVYGEELHDIFDETMVEIEISENIDFIDIATTWHNDETLTDTFWECFFATTLPERADLDNIAIVCKDIHGFDRSDELKRILDQFNKE